MAEFMDKALDWNDEIENDGQGFALIPEGDYHFGVQSFERGRHGGSEKIPACNKAVLTLAILGPEYPFKKEILGTVQTNLFLHSKFEWKLCQFFTAIGLRKHGEKLKMDWSKVTWAEGTCHVGVRKWTGNDGKEHESNEITEFYDPETSPLMKTDRMTPDPAATIDGFNPKGGTFTPGTF